MKATPDIAARASVTYAALCALDPDDAPAERSAALAAGVPLERAAVLYPIALDAIAEPLIEHFQQTGLDHLAGEAARHHLNTHRRSFSAATQGWPLPLKRVMAAQNPCARPYPPAIWELRHFLRDQLPKVAPDYLGKERLTDVYYIFPLVLWHAWWLMAQREGLPADLRAFAETEMAWAGERLLPNIAVTSSLALA